MPKYSVVIPVYNRPDEIDELLKSLTCQSFKDFEILIIEDGSEIKCEHVVKKYESKLQIKYYFKENSGQGFSRNFGAEKAEGEWLIFFDSDCIVPEDYLNNLDELININSEVEAYCGPDAARSDFSILQKAISYSMTSFLTTGGIRGEKVKLDKIPQLRSYNLVLKASSFQYLEGFAKTNMGEDMELSHRFQKEGYRAIISTKLKVFHKRRNSLKSFYNQIFSFGRTRIQLSRDYSIPVKLYHLFPTAFIGGLFLSIAILFINLSLGAKALSVYAFYFLLVFAHSGLFKKSVSIGFLSILTTFLQHTAYGLGFIYELIQRRTN
ncbi:glycosyltransferase [Ekhidna sp.]|uniref:glycosyltransferase n=1 Tax=Ekhidna sp. TaxID=2608089 RepID=UPI003B50F3FA